MSVDNDKPYVLRVAELIYSQVVKIKNENSEMTNIQAFEVFMTTKDYDLLTNTSAQHRVAIYSQLNILTFVLLFVLGKP